MDDGEGEKWTSARFYIGGRNDLVAASAHKKHKSCDFCLVYQCSEG